MSYFISDNTVKGNTENTAEYKWYPLSRKKKQVKKFKFSFCT